MTTVPMRSGRRYSQLEHLVYYVCNQGTWHQMALGIEGAFCCWRSSRHGRSPSDDRLSGKTRIGKSLVALLTVRAQFATAARIHIRERHQAAGTKTVETARRRRPWIFQRSSRTGFRPSCPRDANVSFLHSITIILINRPPARPSSQPPKTPSRREK